MTFQISSLILLTFSIMDTSNCQYLDPNLAATTFPSLSPAGPYTLGYQQQPVLLPSTYASGFVTPPNSFYPVRYTGEALAPAISGVPASVSLSSLPSYSAQSGDYGAVGYQVAGDLDTSPSDSTPADVSVGQARALYKRKSSVRTFSRPGRTVTRLINIVKY